MSAKGCFHYNVQVTIERVNEGDVASNRNDKEEPMEVEEQGPGGVVSYRGNEEPMDID